MKKYIGLFLVLSILVSFNSVKTNTLEINSKQYLAQINSWTFKTDLNENGEADVGDEFCVAEECFRVVSNDGEKVVLFANYNLNVGNVCTAWNSCAPIENPTGIQDVNSKARFYDKETYSDVYPRIGVTAFSSTHYWLDSSGAYKEKYGEGRDTDAPIFDENSYLYEPVQNYKAYLESKGAEFSVIRLLYREELFNITECIKNEYGNIQCSGTATYSPFPDWIVTGSFWMGDAIAPNKTGGWKPASFNDNGWTPYFYADYYDRDTELGVRPALEVELDKLIPPPVVEEIIPAPKEEVKNPKTGVSNFAIAGIFVCLICLFGIFTLRSKSLFR